MFQQLIACLNVLHFVCSLQPVYHTDIILGNKESGCVEIYRLTINCRPDNWCTSKPITSTDRWYKSRKLGNIGDAKRISYDGKDAILVLYDECAAVLDGNNPQLFHFNKCFDTNVHGHGIEVLPDGNIVLLQSDVNGYGLLIKKGLNPVDGETINSIKARIPNMKVRYGHGLVFDRSKNLMFVLEYLKLSTYKYDAKTVRFTLVQVDKFDDIYESNDKNEGDEAEDGGHDLYPASKTSLFMTTGERVFTYKPKTKFQNHRRFFYVLSKNGLVNGSRDILFKGGIKSISTDLESGLVVAKAAPYFAGCENNIECENGRNYYTKGITGLVWYLPNSQCYIPNFDLPGSDLCNIRFSGLKVTVYKARIYRNINYAS